LNQERAIGNLDQLEFLALVEDLRPELHRYCARLTGSVIDGEDVVQDTFVKAFVALKTLEGAPPMRAWLFRIAHNRAIDLLRSRAVRVAEPLDSALETAGSEAPDPLETLMHKQAVSTAISLFVELPAAQRSAVILKDVLGHSLDDIADLLGITINAVKGHLARGRSRLKEVKIHASPNAILRTPSEAVARYVALFNQRDWESLRALLADDVRLTQSSHPLRVGAEDVGMFFTIYARSDAVRLVPAWIEEREVIAVFENAAATKPSHIMWLEWRDGMITFIRDYRYVGYVIEGAELILLGGLPRVVSG
jgi:RNA polymerase sigma factor (sigma-70 family)